MCNVIVIDFDFEIFDGFSVEHFFGDFQNVDSFSVKHFIGDGKQFQRRFDKATKCRRLKNGHKIEVLVFNFTFEVFYCFIL